MLTDFIATKFPAGDATDGQYLYRSLGSFWTQIFQDKNALKGYTIGAAEEAIQAYYRLADTLKQFAVKDIELYHKEKWKPLVIKKSEFNKTPFVFEADGAVFGKQPSSDKFYGGKLFRFGLPKETNGNVFSFSPTYSLGNFGAIANRLIAPSMLLVPGVDVILQDNTLYFNSNLFDNDYIPRAKLVGDLGAAITYNDVDGNQYEDEYIILWIYHAEIDDSALYYNFGAIFDINLPTSQSYKELLKALMNLSVEGPTIAALNIIFAALANIPVAIEPREIVEDLYADTDYNYLVTDKHVYRIATAQHFRSDIIIGTVLYAGDILGDSVKLVDTVIKPDWWVKEITSDKLGFASHVFAAGVKNQLFFQNTVELITYAEGKITFPVLGRSSDVEAFHTYINTEDNKPALLSALGLSDTITSKPINPVEFLFSNVFKNNTLLLKLDFYTETQLDRFFELFPTLQDYLPPYVYVLTYLTMRLPADELSGLNTGMTIPGFTEQTFSFDGSVSATGERPELAEDLDYYKDYVNRLFCVAVGPYREGEPLHHSSNLDVLTVNNATIKDTEAGIKCGLMRTEIPVEVIPPGESEARLPSTKEVPSILLIDF